MTEPSSRPTQTIVSFVAGVLTCLIVRSLLEKRSRRFKRSHAGATDLGEDLSLFYGDPRALTTVTDRQRFLEAEIYGALVRDAVVCCVDIVLVRRHPDGREECLLVERSSEPVQGVWWWPGGRLLKGETFFDAAKRKAQQETGIMKVQCRQVLGVWNTFFPTSAWDNEVTQGTQTVNAVVLVEVVDANDEVRLDATSENYRWIPVDADLAEAHREDVYVVQSLRRLQDWRGHMCE